MKRWIGTWMGGLVLAAALSVPGCSTNQPARQQARDIAITTEVKTKLASEVQLSTLTDIEINTTNGVVTLAGTVDTQAEKDMADALVRGISGVTSVNNNLQVKAATYVPSAGTT